MLRSNNKKKPTNQLITNQHLADRSWAAQCHSHTLGETGVIPELGVEVALDDEVCQCVFALLVDFVALVVHLLYLQVSVSSVRQKCCDEVPFEFTWLSLSSVLQECRQNSQTGAWMWNQLSLGRARVGNDVANKNWPENKGAKETHMAEMIEQ